MPDLPTNIKFRHIHYTRIINGGNDAGGIRVWHDNHGWHVEKVPGNNPMAAALETLAAASMLGDDALTLKVAALLGPILEKDVRGS